MAKQMYRGLREEYRRYNTRHYTLIITKEEDAQRYEDASKIPFFFFKQVSAGNIPRERSESGSLTAMAFQLSHVSERCVYCRETSRWPVGVPRQKCVSAAVVGFL